MSPQQGGRIAAVRPGARRLRAITTDRSGGSAVEFALLLPLMMSLAFGTIQYSMLFYTYNSMIGAARYAVNTVQRGDVSITAAETVARTMLPPWVPAGDYTVSITDAPPGAPVIVVITVNSNKAAIIPYVPMPATMTVRTQFLKS